MFFSGFKKAKSQNSESLAPAPPTPVDESKLTANTETETEAVTESGPDGASALDGTILGRLFHKQEEQAGPDTSYENESWAPELYVGLFRKKRAVAEEQLSSTPDAQ